MSSESESTRLLEFIKQNTSPNHWLSLIILLTVRVQKLIKIMVIGESTIDVWDIMSAFILLIIAVAFIIGDYARKKGYVR